MMSNYYLEAREVKKYFPVKQKNSEKEVMVKAVDGVSLALESAETVGLVGESGCGKTTLGRLLLLLDLPDEGVIRFKDNNVMDFSKDDLREFRRTVQPVFQNPYSSLNPRMRAGSIISEPLRVNTRLHRAEIRERIAETLVTVGLQANDADKYPHEFSGGQRQRIAIARALASNPKVIVLDEAVSSQDISIRAQILNLLKDLQEGKGLGYLFIAHDLATVRYMSHRVSVMYLGRIVESAPSDDLYNNPLHPYTQVLLASCLPDDPDIQMEPISLPTEVSGSFDPPQGCHFHPRCPHAKPVCKESTPELKEVAPGHRVACILNY